MKVNFNKEAEMQLIFSILNKIKKMPFSFLFGIIVYLFTLGVMWYWKREPPKVVLYSVFLSWVVGVIYTIFDFFYYSDRYKNVRWIKKYFWPNKVIVKKACALSNTSMLLGALAFLLSLSKVHWLICVPFFVFQIFFSLAALCAYIFRYHKELFKKTWQIGIIFSCLTWFVNIFSQIYSKQFVTSIFNVYPDVLPTITMSMYWYVFLLTITYVIHMLIVIIPDNFNYRWKILKSYSFLIFFSVSVSSISFAGILFINYSTILNQLIKITYQSDTLPIYRCNGIAVNNDKYGSTAGYVNISDELYRVIYFNNEVVETEDVKC